MKLPANVREWLWESLYAPLKRNQGTTHGDLRSIAHCPDCRGSWTAYFGMIGRQRKCSQCGKKNMKIIKVTFADLKELFEPERVASRIRFRQTKLLES